MAEVFQRNLQVLQVVDADLAERLRAVRPAEIQWFESKQPGMHGAVVHLGDGSGSPRRVTLASKFRPADEAAKLADGADLTQHATIVALGIGAGHHVAELARRLAGKGLLVIYEPDESLLAGLLHGVDCTAWLSASHVALFAGSTTTASLTRRLENLQAFVGQGTQFLTHPAARHLHPEPLQQFAKAFTDFVSYCRTNVTTMLVNAAITCSNLTHNLYRYAAGDSVNALAGAAAGFPAVLVSAGPSLARNVDLLADPAIRRRVVIIAVQTVLKPLLARGIRPHFVTALDYHEISQRFYEGLPRLDDVTLVAEAKTHPAVIAAYPGPIRLIRNDFLQKLLGDDAPRMDEIPAGTTVAHLSLYLAQYLGCDPIMLIGQDLGFTDGLYYCPGTAIHQVWANELSPFNTLEMMEWRRIVRHKAHLSRQTDINGQPIFSDEQMMTYLKQFERDFLNCPQRIIDATEGGMPKANTQRSTLAEALQEHATVDLPDLPIADQALDASRLQSAHRQLESRRSQVTELRSTTVNALLVVEKMLQSQQDQRTMQRLFKQLQPLQQRVAELDETMDLVNAVNQLGAFNRLRADRAIAVEAQLPPLERQRRQLTRDMENLRWLRDACDETLAMFASALESWPTDPGGSTAQGACSTADSISEVTR